MIGAKVGAYLLKSRSRSPESFDVRLLRLEETPQLLRREGQTYLRKGRTAVWRNDDLQSFSPLRMMVPQAMGFQGRALVIDPDVFAIGDVHELLVRDMRGKAIVCRNVTAGYRDNGNRFYASSVMLLDCARLAHWQWDRQIDEIFSGRLDYGPWISLLLEEPATIGELEEEWNQFDVLTRNTKMLHNTERSTQPWKTGLPVDYDTTTVGTHRPGWAGAMRRALDKLGVRKTVEQHERYYLPHPDPAQEAFFLRAVRECLLAGVFDEDFLRQEMRQRHVRQDLLERIAALGPLKAAA
jgi:hypothetical protein